MRNEVIKLNATALKTTHQNDTLVQFFTNSDCTGEKAYVYLQGDMCGRFNQNIGGIYFYWRSVYVPAHATLNFEKVPQITNVRIRLFTIETCGRCTTTGVFLSASQDPPCMSTHTM